MKFHPDRNQGDKEAEAKFKEIKEAYEVLTDAQNVRPMINMVAAFEQGGMGGGGFGGGGFGGGADFSDIFGDVFGDIFGGGGRGRQRSWAAQTCATTWTRRWKKRFAASPKRSVFRRAGRCDVCHGSGAGKRDSATDLPNAVTVPVRCRCAGFFAVQRRPVHTVCGRDTLIKRSVHQMSWSRSREKTKTLSVKIPAGVDTGDRIRLAGEGEAGEHGAPAGDLVRSGSGEAARHLRA